MTDHTHTPAEVSIRTARVMRGGDWIVVDNHAYKLRECTEAAAVLVIASGSENIGFDMPGWFFTGSPYGEQIKSLGVTPQEIPKDFVFECVPDLGKVWRSRQTIWETYIRSAPDPREEVIAQLVEALEKANHRLKRVPFNVAMEINAALAAAKAVM